MDWWNGLNVRTRADAPLGERTWFRLGGRAAWMVWPKDAEAAAGVIRRAAEMATPWRVLGRGANVLVSDAGFDGVVLMLDEVVVAAGPDDRHVERHGEPLDDSLPGVFLHGDGLIVPAGVDLMKLSHACSRRGLAGLECMGGIPGTVGGAVRMNAGGRWGAFGDVVRSVELIDSAGHVVRHSRDEMGFGYRQSNVNNQIVWSAELALKQDDPVSTLAQFHEIWNAKKQEQPMADRSAGCIFKNPPGLSAGRLIDEAGLKDLRRGGAWVSSRHANFILADENARADDVVGLIDDVRGQVESIHGVRLETEIDIW